MCVQKVSCQTSLGLLIKQPIPFATQVILNDMERGKKNRRLYVRLTEEELAVVKEKAKNYQTITSMLLAAVKNLDNRTMSNKIDVVLELKATLDEQNRQLGKIGANLNQIAKYFNQISNAGIIGDYRVQEAVGLVQSLNEYRDMMNKSNDILITKIIR